MASASGRPVNWAGNISFRAARLHRPATIAELRRLVAGSRRLRALGTGHSFSPLADTTGDLVSLVGLPPLIEPDPAGSSVTVSAGLRYSDVAPRLRGAAAALRNLGSLPHISVAGAVATGTHGSGDANGSLATAVTAVQLVTADGDLVTVRRAADPDRFAGMVVALGACGVVTSLTLETVPTFDIRQYVYDGVPFDQVLDHFDEITGAAYSVSMFTDWRQRRMTQTWLKTQASEPVVAPLTWLGGRLATGPRHPIAGQPAANCTEQLGVPGRWDERLPHFRPEFTPSAGAELQSEYLLPRRHAVRALAELDGIRAVLAPVTQVSEIRTVAADDLWLSPCYQRDSAAFHFTWVPDADAVAPVMARVEAALAQFAARPHWAKLFAAAPAAVAALYPRLDDFGRLADEFDPAGKFRNDMLDGYLSAR